MKFRKAVPSGSDVTSNFDGNRLNNDSRYEFPFVFSILFFNLLYYSYKMHLRKFKRLHPANPKLQQFLVKICWIITPDTSFHSFSLIRISICFTIATKCTCKVSKGCTQWFQSYNNFSGKRLNNDSRYEFSFIFSNSFFNLLYYSYEMHLQIFERLHPAVRKLEQFLVKVLGLLRL